MSPHTSLSCTQDQVQFLPALTLALLCSLSSLYSFSADNNSGVCGAFATAGNTDHDAFSYALGACPVPAAPPPGPTAAAVIPSPPVQAAAPAPASGGGSSTGGIAGIQPACWGPGMACAVGLLVRHGSDFTAAVPRLPAALRDHAVNALSERRSGPKDSTTLQQVNLSKTLSSACAAGGVVAGVAALALIAGVASFFIVRRNRRKRPGFVVGPCCG